MSVKLFISAAAVLSLVGCTTNMLVPIKAGVKEHDVKAASYLNEIQKGVAKIDERSPIEHVNEIWIPMLKAADVSNLNNIKFDAKRRITVNRDFRNIQEVAERVTQLTGMPVTVSADALVAQRETLAEEATGTMTPAPAGNPIGGLMPPIPPAIRGANGSGAVNAVQTGVMLTYDGPLDGFLNVAGARFGVSWEWAQDNIHFFHYTTKTFRLVALPGESTLQATITSQTGGAGGGGTSTVGSGANAAGGASSTSGVSFTNLSVWTAVKEAIQGMLSKKDNVVVTPATGTVTVTDTPQVIAKVEKFIEQQNAALGKQVVVNVRVLSVELNDTDQYGINWNALYSSLNGKYGFGLSNAFAVSPNASNLALKILGGNGDESGLSAWAGSQAIISALSTQGDVSQLTSTSLTTLNNQQAPFQVGRQTSYIAQSSTTLSQGAGATTSFTPGTVTTGFSMSVVPHILEKQKLLLQFGINISSLLELKTLTSNGSIIQTPDVDTRNFLQRVKLNSGDTLIMAGFEQTILNASSQGVGDPSNAALGGGVNGKKARSVLVILIQPIIGEA